MIQLSFEQFEEILTQTAIKSEEENSKEGIYHSSYSSTIDTSVCKGNALNISIREGITLIKTQLRFTENTTIEMKSFLPQIGFWYCLKGHIKGFRQNMIPRKSSAMHYELSPRKGMIYATAASNGWIQLEKDKLYKALYLIFTYQTFRQLIGEHLQTMPEEFIRTLEDENGYFSRLIQLSSQATALCEAIFDNPYSGKSRQFYREAKVIELIAYQIDELTKPVQELHSTGIKLTGKEEKQIEYCRQALLSSLQDPPSLIELAKQIGISDYRLKNGFRQMYGVTPYRFIVDIRMTKAKELLQKKEMTVSEVAAAVGFTSLGSFSNSFYEKFGIRPSEL